MKNSNEAEMKLLYTDIRTSLTEILTREAEELVLCWQAGLLHRSQLFFWKGTRRAGMLVRAGFFCDYRHALYSNGSLPDFEWFACQDQSWWYWSWDGLYKCLAELDPKDLRVYGAIKQDPQFIQQLIELYHEMTKAQMSFWTWRVWRMRTREQTYSWFLRK